MVDRILKWLFLSSADPKKASASVKFFLLGIVPYIINAVTAACGLGLVCLGVDAESLNQVVAVVANIVEGALYVVAGLGFLWAFFRKLTLTARGENKVFAGE